MRKLFVPLAAAVVLLAVAAAAAAVLVASLPRRGGEAVAAGLEAEVRIELDALGIPRIRAATAEDAYFAHGFLHAQDRFFQMDLSRRSAAGELAALAGPALLDRDRRQRVFQLRKRARAVLESLPARHRAALAAYARGVNAGLADLGARPPEYWLLRMRPEPWRAEDSVLVVFALYTMLSSNHVYERPQAVIEAVLAPGLVEFLTPQASRFDRPLGAPANDATGGYRALPLPASAEVGPAPERRARPVVSTAPAGGASNAWAVGGARSAHGAAIVANDPHLDLGLPNVFHRAELHWPEHAVRGVGIAGVPGIVIGATDDLAWGLTASYADQSDWVVVEAVPGDADAYRVPGGTLPFVVERELIEVRGRAEPDVLDVRSTIWGPVAGEDGLGRPLALHATWLEPDGVDVDMLDLALAASVPEGLEIVAGWAGPSLAWILADRAGNVGWGINGPLPARVGFDGTAPRSWARGDVGWRGLVRPPTIHGGPGDTVHAANGRPLPTGRAETIGGIWMPGFRAKRIVDRLGAEARLDEADMGALQLDTRAEAYDRIRAVVLEVLDEDESDPLLADVRAAVESWSGRADVPDIGFRLLHVYYHALLEQTLAPLLTPARAADANFVYRWPLADEAMRRLLDERPRHLLPPGFDSWRAYLRHILERAVRGLGEDGRGPPPDAAWGEANRLSVGHVLADLPPIGRMLRLPEVPQAGSPVSVRVAEPARGAVIRMVVSPAHPERGILQLIGGQSGHFLSRHFDDQWPGWRDGAPAPFLAGRAVSAFTLAPPRPDQSNAARTIDGGS